MVDDTLKIDIQLIKNLVERACTPKTMAAVPTLVLKGAFTAMVTPFTEDGLAVDYEQLKENVEFQIAQGINGLVPCGTTGECPTISHDEHEKVIDIVVKTVAGRVPVIAGTGSNCTAEAVRLTSAAKASGADAALIVNPYYNKPGQRGLFEHFKTICSVGLPVVLYNIPSRTGIKMDPATVAELHRQFPEIVAIKEATGSLDQATEIATLCDIQILSGDDSLTLPLMSVGGTGVISVASNASPKKVLAITDAAAAGDYAAAREAHLAVFNLCKAFFVEPNPQPIKAAMHMMGMCNETVRLPLVSASDETKALLKATLTTAGLLAAE